MIPKLMEDFLRSKLPDETWENRLIRKGGRCYLEFTHLDIDRLARMDIEVDSLGPRLVVCMWNEEAPIEIGGYLVVDNLAMGKPSMGGIRKLPDVTPSAIHNLARGMTLKNAAADLPYGGGKAGIVAERSLTSLEHSETVRGFAQLLYPYRDIYLPGPDVGTNDSDMKIIAIENGLDNALSKPIEMGGNRIDRLGAAAGGTIIALDALIHEMPRLKTLPQFEKLYINSEEPISVLIQGFGAVGAHAARILKERIPDALVVGISDALGYLFDRNGLPVDQLFNMWLERGLVTKHYYDEYIDPPTRADYCKYSNAPNDLLRETAFCLIPAAPIANYLDIDESTNPSMIVRDMGDWWLIIEGANTYSPETIKKTLRSRMERVVYRQKGVLIATDYLVNSGGVIYAAQEHMIKTPEELRIPDAMLGDSLAVEGWLKKHQTAFESLAGVRRNAARDIRDEVIRRNMREFISSLISDSDMLPCEAAERISISRMTLSESEKTAADVMASIPAISKTMTIRKASSLLIQEACPIIAILANRDELVGVLTEWDITKATAKGINGNEKVEEFMSHPVIWVEPDVSLVEVIRKLEYHEISAMPVVENGIVVGMISSDLLARNSLLKLLQT